MNTTVKNRINFNNDYSYFEPIYVPEGGDKSFGGEKKRSTVEYEDILVLFPNPSNAYFTVDYSLRETFNTGKLVIMDASGKIIRQIEINFSRDQILISTDNWPSGIYSCTLLIDGKTALTQQITVIK